MPGCGLHLLLGCQILDHWEREPAQAPFAPGERAARAAFLLGCNAPDMGYFPGGLRLLSDLAHYIRTGPLLRELVTSARSEVERAFAWGWACHVLADVRIHPLVNEAAGELLTGKRVSRSFDDDPVAHVQMEMGADAYHVLEDRLRHCELPRCVFDRDSVVYLVRAYRSAYGVTFSERQVLASLRGLERWAPWLLFLNRISGGRFHRCRIGWRETLAAWTVLPLVRLATAARRNRGAVYALTHTFAPLPWFEEALRGERADFVERFSHLQRHLDDWPSYNLDLAQIEGERPTYPPTLRAHAELDSLREHELRARKERP